MRQAEVGVGLDQRLDLLARSVEVVALDLLEDVGQQRFRTGVGIAGVGGCQRAAGEIGDCAGGCGGE